MTECSMHRGPEVEPPFRTSPEAQRLLGPWARGMFVAGWALRVTVVLAVATLSFAAPRQVISADADLQCDESDIVEVADAISIKQITGTILEDGTPQLMLHFDIPPTLKDATLHEVFVSVIGPEDELQFNTPLKTWVMEDGLEGMLTATEPRVRDYTVSALYTPREGVAGCGIVTRLELAGHPVIDDRLACLQKSTWVECNLPGLSGLATARDRVRRFPLPSDRD